MVQFLEVYRTVQKNSTIAATEREVFGVSRIDQAQKLKHGSFNVLNLSNNQNDPITIKLDSDDNTEEILITPGNYQIEPEDGQFFNYVEITAGALAIGADEIVIRMAVAKRIGS